MVLWYFGPLGCSFWVDAGSTGISGRGKEGEKVQVEVLERLYSWCPVSQVSWNLNFPRY